MLLISHNKLTNSAIENNSGESSESVLPIIYEKKWIRKNKPLVTSDEENEPWFR